MMQPRKSSRRWMRTLLATGLMTAMLMTLMPLTSALAQKEIVIGSTLPQSGRFQGMAKPFPRLLKAWAAGVNAKGGIYLSKLGKKLPIRLVLYDDQSTPPTALKFYERMATVDKVDLFIGPFTSFITNAAIQAALTHKIPMFMVEANDPVMFKKPNKWRATGLDKAEAEYTRTVDFFAKKGGVKTFALLSRDNLHEKQVMIGFDKMLQKAGFKVVYHEVAPKGIKDFSSIVLGMRQKKPDVVFIEGLPPPFNIGFLKAARQLGLNPKEMVVGHMPIPVVKAMGKSAENIMSSIYFFEGNTADHKEYVGLTKKLGFKPWHYSESGIRYTAYKRVEEALKRAGSLDKEAIRKAMWETNMTIWGERVKITKEGYGTINPWPTQVQNGEHISLWPLKDGVKRHKSKNGKW